MKMDGRGGSRNDGLQKWVVRRCGKGDIQVW